MKRFLTFLLPALMLFAAGCKDKNEPSSKTLSVNPELITCPDAGGDYTIELTSPNGSWSATTNESWIRVTPTAGEKGTTEVRIKISPNKESAESKGVITFSSGEETVSFPVTRAAKAAPYLRIVSDLALNTPKEGGSYTVQIESNIKWSASSNVGWAKVSKGVSVNNDNITVTVSPATTPEETTARIIVSPYGEGYDAGSDTVIITRGSTEATSLSVDPTEINAPADGGSFMIGVSSNAKWRVYKTWDMDWLTFSGSQEGDGNGSFSFSIEEATSMDDVSGILTIEEDRSDNYKPVVTQVAVSRAGKAAAELSVAPTTINASVELGTYLVAIKSNYPWTATQSGNFFSLSTTSGDGYTNMVVTVQPATSERETTGYIIIRTSFGNEQARVNIKRAGLEPEPESESVYTYHPFSIPKTATDTIKVYISPGNLQYRASTDTWRFAKNQYDYIGTMNTNISPIYSGWIDLFGWGTGDNPTQCSANDNDYPTYTDWGVNAISNGGNEANAWRTLTSEEWGDLIIHRSKSLFGFGSVNGVNGLIVLPDDWTLPAGASFTPSTKLGLGYFSEHAHYKNTKGDNFTHNTYTKAQWAVMEAAGAVFLPAAGYRHSYYHTIEEVGSGGFYWTATDYGIRDARLFQINASYLGTRSFGSRSMGNSVRLVKVIN